jgi:hypothetical protein
MLCRFKNNFSFDGAKYTNDSNTFEGFRAPLGEYLNNVKDTTNNLNLTSSNDEITKQTIVTNLVNIDKLLGCKTTSGQSQQITGIRLIHFWSAVLIAMLVTLVVLNIYVWGSLLYLVITG